MLLAYFDEVKVDPPNQPYFWLGGLVISPDIAPVLEAEVGQIANECFGENAPLTKETEFHACAIANRTGPFKGFPDPAARFGILKRLIKCYAKPDGVYRVAVRIEPQKLYAGVAAEDLALVFLIERINDLAKSKGTVAMLIGDFEKEKTVNRSVRNLHKFRQTGTPYDFGRPINAVIDTLHFAHSHHSRLLQLADIFMWTRQLTHRKGPQNELRTDLLKFIQEDTDTHWEHKYKYWPPS